MTCIVGVEHDGDVWIGSDSQVTLGGTKDTMPSGAKVFRAGGVLIGGCGTVRLLNLLRWGMTVTERPAGTTPEDWLVTWWAAAARAALKEHGWLKVSDGREDIFGHLLVGYAGALWYVDSALGIYRSALGYNASGSGMDYALGSLHTTRSGEWRPEARLGMALEAAEAFNTACRGPFTIERLGAS